MKHALKILIPLVVVAALVVGGCWFFLNYRPDLTCRILTNRAAAAMDAGRYPRAVSLYQQAAKLDPDNTTLAVELADAYEHIDNYTKAEYTLVSAISDHPDVLNLYLALSRVYVAQDKLLDAEEMLSRVADSSVREQLSAMRPAAPVIQPGSGYYSQYVDASLSYSGGAAYLTTDGTFPSLADNLYTDPVQLQAGESKVEAVVVSDEGLVSPLAESGFTIGGVIEKYTFTDPAFEACVRKVLNKGKDDAVMTNELWALTSLDLTDDVADLSDLEQCHGLTSLSMHGTYGVDFSVLSKVPSLTTLDLSGCTVSSAGVEAIGSLTSLTSLNLSGCALTDISSFSGLTALTKLDLSSNAVSDLTALSGMSALEELKLGTNAVTSLTPLAACSSLKYLDVSSNQVTSLAALKNKKSLISLAAAGNQIADLSPLSGCAALQLLDVSSNSISDLSPIASLAYLQSVLANHNTLVKVPNFSAAQQLAKISLSNNAITDISGLAKLPILNYVDLDYNKVTSLDALKECGNLVQVDASNNPLTNVSALTEHGVIVNYTPAAKG